MSDNLLPCPFCGAEALWGHDRSSDYASQWRYYVECVVYEPCGTIIYDTTLEKAMARWNTRADTKRVLLDFYNKVCDQAERNMAATNTVSGAHWNAMRKVLTDLGIEANR